ncbi:MAG TPA: septation protein IspZ [Candidatus Azosocius sp. HAIN]
MNLLNILNIILFFILFQYSNIYYSIVIIIITCIINIIHYKKKNNNKIYIIIIILTLGLLTIISQNELFIKWKPTITYTIISLILINDSKNKKELIIQKIGQKIIKLPKKDWVILNYIWSTFFFIISLINIYISYKFNIKIWLYFKIFGITTIIIIFLLIQLIYIKYIYKK